MTRPASPTQSQPRPKKVVRKPTRASADEHHGEAGVDEVRDGRAQPASWRAEALAGRSAA